MCGICAGIGCENQVVSVLDGLKKLEYRGYDSAGLAGLKNGKIVTVKATGQIKNLQKKVPENFVSKIVVGHTRWATHGIVSEENAHPHLSSDGQFAMVHNGIIENFLELKNQMTVDFVSQTDTEVFVNLIAKQKGNTFEKMKSACDLVVGSFAIALISQNERKIYVAKRHSPIMVAVGKQGAMTASDISVFAGKFDYCFVMEDDEFCILDEKSAVFFDKNGKKIEKNKVFLDCFDFGEENSSEKYFMQKEIKEQTTVLRKTYFKYFSEQIFCEYESLKKFKAFHFVACGTAYHACLLGAKYIQDFCKKPCVVSVASEFRYAKNPLSKSTLYVFVSQSGETADTIACAKLVKENGCKVMCVTNVPYCSLNNLADFVLPNFAGREVAVASTKAYTAQVFTLLIFALKLSKKADKEHIKKFVLNFEIPPFDDALIEQISHFKKVFFIGRGQDFVTALEGALKLKEIAYLNCLGISAGELKHGTLALIDEDTLVVAISTQSETKEKMESNILEVKARGGKVLLISCLKHNFETDFKISLSNFEENFMPIVSVVPLQQLAFSYARKQGFNPDKPRNLAKSVTVE